MKILKRTFQGLFFFSILMGFIILSGTIKRNDIYFGQFFFDALLLAVTIISVIEMIITAQEAGYPQNSAIPLSEYKKDKEKINGYNPLIAPLITAVVLSYPAIKFFGYKGLLLLMALEIILLFLFYVFNNKVKINDFLISIFIFIYPILPMTVAMQLVNAYGMIPLLTAIGSAMMADVFAFYFGSLIKGPKIFPKISPKKTYSGSIMGLVGGVIGALVVYALFELTNLPLNRVIEFKNYFNPWIFYPLTGLVIGFLGEIGDLAASRIKRCTGVKDFGKIMGSHGGIIDRLDSIFFAVIYMAIFMSFAFA